MEILSHLGFSEVILQIGRGEFEPTIFDISPETPLVTYYRLKESIAEDIAQADLIISHAGAGSITDSLGADKPVLVVVNEELMGNHQTDLAEKLASDGHLHYCGVSSLLESLQTLDFTNLKPFPPGKPEKFVEHLDKLMGFA